MKPYTDKELPRLDTYIRNHGSAQGFVRDKPRKKPDNEESRHQKAFVKWWRMNARSLNQDPRALMSIPNGGVRDKVTASILKDEGAVRGAPDLFLAIPQYRGVVRKDEVWDHGMFIEMKAAHGVTSIDQVAVHGMMKKNGYLVVICHSFEEAKAAVTEYLGE